MHVDSPPDQHRCFLELSLVVCHGDLHRSTRRHQHHQVQLFHSPIRRLRHPSNLCRSRNHLSLYLQNCRYWKARLTGLFLVWVTYFAVALRYYGRFTSVTAAGDPSPEVADAFEAICIRRPRVIQEAVVPGITLIAFLPGALCALPASVYAIGMAGRWMGLPRMPFPRHTHQPVGWSQHMYLYVGAWLLSLPLMVATALTMIAVLVALTLLRYETIRLAGPSLTEANWSFGQILSFATWAPTIVDFLVVLVGKACDDSCMCRLRTRLTGETEELKGLEYRLPLGVGIAGIGNESDKVGMLGGVISLIVVWKMRLIRSALRRWKALFGIFQRAGSGEPRSMA